MAGVLLYKPGWLGLASVGTLGVLIVVVTLILSLIPKAADADDLNANLEPIYTPELVDAGQGRTRLRSAQWEPRCRPRCCRHWPGSSA